MRELIAELEEIILAGSGSDSFREIFKLLYIKLYVEKFSYALDDEHTFRTLFEQAKQEWPGIFEVHETITIPDSLVQSAWSLLQKIRLLRTDLSVIDAAFEQLLPPVAKGNRGQYFTPRHVIRSIVQMMAVKENEFILDPAAGSGGFLLETIAAIKEKKFAADHVYGIDFDERAYMACKAMLLIAGHGNTHVYRFNSLERLEKVFEVIGRRNFDVVLSNPPFGGEVRDENLLLDYELASNSKGKNRNVVERHILFLERIIKLLKPGGRAAIIVPQGMLNNTNLDYVRNWLFDKARVLGVIGLDTNTFKPYTTVKTSILLLQKWERTSLANYPIFMAVSKKNGKDASGNLSFSGDNVNCDLEHIAVDFRLFVTAQRLEF